MSIWRRRLGTAAATALAAAWALASALVAAPAGAEECLECHELDAEVFTASVHGGFDCADCHSGADDPDHPEGLTEASCADCHDDAASELEASAHHRADLGPTGRALDCADCHGDAHELLAASDPQSPTHPANLAGTCGACHANPELAGHFRLRRVRPVEAYREGVHARAVARGDPGPGCSDCHLSHLVLPAADDRSPVHHERVPETCGGCHGEITEAYAKSVHGEAAARGIRESPVCTDCHGEHRILSPRERGSPVYATNIPKMTCGRCHGDLRLSDKFGLSMEKVPAYADSFHGLAMRTGVATVAQCASCHGVHDILPSTDPRSHTHPQNLSATCGACHPGAGARFAIGPVHVLPESGEHAAVFWVRRVYLWLIFVVIGGMVLHNGLDFVRKVRSPPARPRRRPPGDRQRMGLGFRITHALLAVSFILLAYTGFALKYPEAGWAVPLLRFESSFGLRGWLHRVAAMVMLVTALGHLLHLIVDRGARTCIAAMRPGRDDLVELIERCRYFLGLAKRPPATPWLGYGEKLEYLAVVWGTAVMAVTGFLLWAETLALRWLPTWALDVATTVHFYEAVLATLAIVVWHFYAVIFDPVVYPVDPAWLTGYSAPGRSRERLAPGAPAPGGAVAAPVAGAAHAVARQVQETEGGAPATGSPAAGAPASPAEDPAS